MSKQKRKCTKGYSCGLSCISNDRSCNSGELTGQSTLLAEGYFDAIKKGKPLEKPFQDGSSSNEPEPEKIKPTKERSSNKEFEDAVSFWLDLIRQTGENIGDLGTSV